MSDVTAPAAATEQTGSVNLADSIASIIAANKRNNPKPEGAEPPPAGQEEAKAESPEATPEEGAEPEGSSTEPEEGAELESEEEPSEAVSDSVNFLEFAKANPKAIIEIPNKDAEGGVIKLTAERAASILGQGSAIHENARKLKAERADFEEYEAKRRAELDGLQIGLELTMVPQLETAANDLVTLQGYNQQWTQILNSSTDPVKQSEARAAIKQNAELIEEKSEFIRSNRPKVENFFNQRASFVKETIEKARQGFTDKELANKANFNELRERLEKDWKGAKHSYIPGVPNLDLVSSDEYLLGLIRDGMKFRDGPTVRNAGGSLAAASRQTGKAKTAADTKAEELQKRAAKGDKAATRDLLATFIASKKRK